MVDSTTDRVVGCDEQWLELIRISNHGKLL